LRGAFQDGLNIQRPLPPRDINSRQIRFFSLIFTPPVLESGLCKIKAAQQHREARRRESHLAALRVLVRRGQAKAPLLQALGAHLPTRTVPADNLEAVALGVGKHKEVPECGDPPGAGGRRGRGGRRSLCVCRPVRAPRRRGWRALRKSSGGDVGQEREEHGDLLATEAAGDLQHEIRFEQQAVGCAAWRGWRRRRRQLQFEKGVCPGFSRGRRRGHPPGAEVSAQGGEAKSLRLYKLSSGQVTGVESGKEFADLQRGAAAFGLGGMRHVGRDCPRPRSHSPVDAARRAHTMQLATSSITVKSTA
jgi:hypothetical protein